MKIFLLVFTVYERGEERETKFNGKFIESGVNEQIEKNIKYTKKIQ